MPIHTPSNATLLQIFNEKDGIFENTMQANETNFQNLTLDFIAEEQSLTALKDAQGRDLNFQFNIPDLSIPQLISNIENQQKSNPAIAHLGIYYGLSSTESDTSVVHKINLIMQGVKLNDGNEGADLVFLPVQVSTTTFSSDDLTLRPELNQNQLSNFINTFNGIYGVDNFVTGTFIRANSIINVLNDFHSEGCENLQITVGFRKDDDESNPNCYHLIFKGVKANNSLSSKIFSTFDNEEGYNGPKPSRPPFGNQ